MGRILLLALAALAIALTAKAQPVANDHLIIPGISMGSAELKGADQGALFRELGEPNETERHGDHEYYRYGSGDDADALVVDFDLSNDEPFELGTGSAAYRTQEGLGVGSSEQAIRSALGTPVCESHDQRGNGLLVYDSIWFLIQASHATRVSIRRHLSASDFRTGPVHC